MKTTLVFSLLLLCLCCTFQAKTQTYQTAVGARIGFPLSASFKHFIKENHAVEVFLGTRSERSEVIFLGEFGYRFWVLGGTYQVHNPLTLNLQGLENLQWYFGGGAAVYFWSWDTYDGNYSQTSVGIQGCIGLDYAFDNLPLNLSLDWNPVVFVNGDESGLAGGYGAIGARYILSGR